MARYNLVLTRAAEKALHQLPKEMVPKVVSAIQSLADHPYPAGCRKLTGEERVFRIRVQNYRILYEIHQKTITIVVLKIGHRKDIYR